MPTAQLTLRNPACQLRSYHGTQALGLPLCPPCQSLLLLALLTLLQPHQPLGCFENTYQGHAPSGLCTVPLWKCLPTPLWASSQGPTYPLFPSHLALSCLSPDRILPPHLPSVGPVFCPSLPPECHFPREVSLSVPPLLYSQHLDGCLRHSRCSVKTSGVADAKASPCFPLDSGVCVRTCACLLGQLGTLLRPISWV